MPSCTILCRLWFLLAILAGCFGQSLYICVGPSLPLCLCKLFCTSKEVALLAFLPVLGEAILADNRFNVALQASTGLLPDCTVSPKDCLSLSCAAGNLQDLHAFS